MTKKIQKTVRPELVGNFTLSKQFVDALYNYLNTQPRSEVNNLCIGIENLPTVEEFLVKVDKHYDSLPPET